MMATTPTKPRKEAKADGSKDQHGVISAFCSTILGITHSAHSDDALNTGLGGQTRLNDGITDDNMTEGVSIRKCWIIEKNNTYA
jgi:hypothetical protein